MLKSQRAAESETETSSWPLNSQGERSFLDSVTLFRKYFERYAGGIYAISLVVHFHSAQGVTACTGACGGACKATTCGLGGAFVWLGFFQYILLQSYLSKLLPSCQM